MWPSVKTTPASVTVPARGVPRGPDDHVPVTACLGLRVVQLPEALWQAALCAENSHLALCLDGALRRDRRPHPSDRAQGTCGLCVPPHPYPCWRGFRTDDVSHSERTWEGARLANRTGTHRAVKAVGPSGMGVPARPAEEPELGVRRGPWVS